MTAKEKNRRAAVISHAHNLDSTAVSWRYRRVFFIVSPS